MSRPFEQVPPTPFGQFLGVEWIERGPEGARVVFDLAPHHCNKRGVAHGGVLSSLLDMTLGASVIAAIRPEEWCATIDLALHFVAPARLGRIEVRGEVLRRARRIAFAEGRITDSAGRILTTARGTWTIWPSHPDRRESIGVKDNV
ncbi:MAG: PaaI family thioesterase [Planctomycetota bacterium]